MFNELIGALVGSTFTVGGIAGLVHSLRQNRMRLASFDWPVAEGIVIASKVEKKRGSKGGATYAPIVRYEYTVDGERYVGDKVMAGMALSTSMRGSAEKIVARYPLVSPVIVYYDPEYPETSLLEPESTANIWMGSVFSLVFFVLGAVVLWSMIPPEMRSSWTSSLFHGR